MTTKPKKTLAVKRCNRKDTGGFGTTNQELQESEKNFRLLAESTSSGIMIADAEGRHVYSNARASEISGYSRSEILRTTIRDWC